MSTSSLFQGRKRLMSAVASVALAGVIGFGAATTGISQSNAEPVRVESQAQVPGFGDIVEKVTPAVVSVRVDQKAKEVAGGSGSFSFGVPNLDDLPNDHPLKRFFRDFQFEGPRGERGGRHGPSRPHTVAQGSGFFISADGYIVTNNHVVADGEKFTIVTEAGKEFEAKLIGTDPRTDLAVLKVDAKDTTFTYVDFADDNSVRVGDWVVAVGNPFGLGGTVTAGIVSARGRDIGAGPYDDFLQIDAAVNRGNSGGPAFNLNGEVVGVNTAIFSPSGGNVGIAFAIPASVARDVVASLMKDGSVQRGWLGVQIQPVNEEIADSLGLSDAKGALIAGVQGDGPAKAADIQTGDVVTKVNGEVVESPRELSRMIAAISPGSKVEISVWRAGKEETKSVDLKAMPGEDQMASVMTPQNGGQTEGSGLDDFGLTVTPSEDGKGLVVTDVDPNGEASQRGIQTGDVIVSVNSQPANDADSVSKAVEDATSKGRKAILLQIDRDGATRFVPMPIAEG
ncbi:Do family serine endopeptidase [Limoniibacter endophyticus]|uniref:Probable periplasmic serine endoprotease DegP-like n=1 Tax=Limoniibacter endophyticus TaxID=1565040 RepID=A0A8J3DRD1_9HYPH|nr:Do family serine endopeptidase [Limoniibacter endophyticus]GHC69239.1 serine peptidase [Limoniibacter endophyticus]